MTNTQYPKGWRLLLFSDPKVGKTSFAETAPGPVLFLNAEGGTNWLARKTVPWNPLDGPPQGEIDNDTVVVVDVFEWEMLERVTRFLKSGKHPFASVVLDSITELQKQAKRAVTDTGMKLQDWGTLYDKMDPILREIRDLTQVPGSNVACVILVALANRKDDRIVPDIQGSMARSLAGQVDTVGYLRPGAMTADGKVSRELVVDARQGIDAGDRTKLLRRTFNGVIPVVLDDETDEIEWNATQLMRLLNQED